MFATKKDDEKAPDVEFDKPKRVRKTKEVSAETEAD
jgi:hypothetical protein